MADLTLGAKMGRATTAFWHTKTISGEFFECFKDEASASMKDGGDDNSKYNNFNYFSNDWIYNAGKREGCWWQ